MELNNKKEFIYLDIFKVICALLVIIIHIPPLGNSNNEIIVAINFYFQNILARIAVPIFFISSSFFLFRKMEKFDMKIVWKYLLRLLILYLVWTIVYLPFQIKDMLENESDLIIKVLDYIRHFVFDGSYQHLWYLPALMFGVFLVSIMLSYNIDINRILVVASLLYIIGLFGQSWYGLVLPLLNKESTFGLLVGYILKIIGTTRNGLNFAFVFVAIGAYFSKIKKINLRVSVVIFIMSTFLMFIEVILIEYFGFALDYNMYLFLIPKAASLFLIVASLECKKNINGLFFRKISSVLYFTHLAFKRIYLTVFDKIDYDIASTPYLLLLVVITCWILSVVIYYLSNKKYFSFLKKLI